MSWDDPDTISLYLLLQSHLYSLPVSTIWIMTKINIYLILRNVYHFKYV